RSFPSSGQHPSRSRALDRGRCRDGPSAEYPLCPAIGAIALHAEALNRAPRGRPVEDERVATAASGGAGPRRLCDRLHAASVTRDQVLPAANVRQLWAVAFADLIEAVRAHVTAVGAAAAETTASEGAHQ